MCLMLLLTTSVYHLNHFAAMQERDPNTYYIVTFLFLYYMIISVNISFFTPAFIRGCKLFSALQQAYCHLLFLASGLYKCTPGRKLLLFCRRKLCSFCGSTTFIQLQWMNFINSLCYLKTLFFLYSEFLIFSQSQYMAIKIHITNCETSMLKVSYCQCGHVPNLSH